MWKKIFGGFIVIIVLMVSLTLYGTSGMTDAVDEFFIHVKTKHYSDAYNLLSPDFKSSVTQEQFKTFLIQNSLTEFKKSNWSSRSFDNNMGKLEGTITTKSGDAIPLIIEFIKNNEEWKIYSIRKQTAGLQTLEKKVVEQKVKNIQLTAQMPSQNVLISLTKESTQVFAQAVNAKDMSNFYSYISGFWQKDTSSEALDNAFDAFYRAGIDFTVLKSITPILNEKTKLLTDGRLLVEGHYPTSPSVVYFNYSYINENNNWKLIGYNINVK